MGVLGRGQPGESVRWEGQKVQEGVPVGRGGAVGGLAGHLRTRTYSRAMTSDIMGVVLARGRQVGVGVGAGQTEQRSGCLAVRPPR